MRIVTVVITDLDNTLFDWVRIWFEPFKAMLDELVRTSGVDETVLIRDIKRVFTGRRTSEYSFVIQEIEALQQKFPGEDLARKFDSAIHAFRSARKRVLALYPGVEEALQKLKDRGVLIVGYTESSAFCTHHRMKELGLDRILDFVYSPADHDFPEGLSPQQVRAFSPEHYELRRTVHRHTPEGKLKPSPDVLLQIIQEVGAIPNEVVYVGDSQMKDITMAQDAGVTDVWAEYGFAQDRPEYELLRQVTHWSAQSVEKEKEMLANPPKPSYTLKESLSEILGLFDFRPFVDRSERRVKLALEAWKVAVDVQMHFNDLEMRIRNFALTLITAVLAAVGLIFKDGTRLHALGMDFPLATAMILGAIPIWIGFYLMDRFWYHNFLLGAVRHGESIERRFRAVLPELGLAEAISKASPTKLGRCVIRSSTKVNLFYLLGLLVLVCASILSLFATKAPDKAVGERRLPAMEAVDGDGEFSTRRAPTTEERAGRSVSTQIGVIAGDVEARV